MLWFYKVKISVNFELLMLWGLTIVIPNAANTIFVSWKEDIAATIYDKLNVNNPKVVKLNGHNLAWSWQQSRTMNNIPNNALNEKENVQFVKNEFYNIFFSMTI